VVLQSTLIDQLPDFVIGIDAQERIVAWNKAAATCFGYASAEIIGKPIATILSTDALRQQHLAAIYDHLAQDGYWEGELGFTTRDDKRRWLFSRASHLQINDSENGVLLMGTQLIDHEIRHHRVQSALDYSQRELSNILSAVGDLVCSYDPAQETFDFISPSCYQLTGYSEHELMDNPRLFTEMIAPEYREVAVQSMHNAKYGQVTRVDYPIWRKDGEERWVLNSLTPVGSDEQRHLICALTDTTAFRELTELKSRMIRMASHDLNNPLSTAVGFFGLLSEDLRDQLSDEHRQMVESVHRSHERMAQMLEELLDFERVEAAAQLNLEDVDMIQLIENIIAEFTFQIKDKQHTVVFEPPQPALIIRADRVQLAHALSNYMSNAIKYTPTVGQITISVSLDHEQLYVEVGDNGLGIPEHARESLFQTFFRAKQPGTEEIPGTGLGLSLVKSVIRQHEGAVYYRPEAQGSTFGFWLPAKVVVQS
jgi:PAS domain S-box-containing protein